MHSEPYLLSPGPINIPSRVMAAMNVPAMHHRTVEFSAILRGLMANLQAIYHTDMPVLPVHATGRASLEAVVLNLLSPGDEAVCVCNGRFGVLFADLARVHGIETHRVCMDWEREMDLEEVAAALDRHPRATAVTVVHCETSTAVVNDIAALGALCRERGRLLLVDCVSSLGGIPFRMDEWGVDAAVTAAQKALMGPTGISFVALSDRAWEAEKSSRFPKAYFSLRDILKKVDHENPETPGSTPVALVAAMREATDMILEEGLDDVLARHARLGDGVRDALAAMGLRPFPDVCARRSNTLTAVWAPEDRKPREIIDCIQEQFNITVKAGLQQYKSRILRIGHMGNFFSRDALILVSAFEVALNRLGVAPAWGAGLEALNGHLSG